MLAGILQTAAASTLRTELSLDQGVVLIPSLTFFSPVHLFTCSEGCPQAATCIDEAQQIVMTVSCRWCNVRPTPCQLHTLEGGKEHHFPGFRRGHIKCFILKERDQAFDLHRSCSSARVSCGPGIRLLSLIGSSQASVRKSYIACADVDVDTPATRTVPPFEPLHFRKRRLTAPFCLCTKHIDIFPSRWPVHVASLSIPSHRSRSFQHTTPASLLGISLVFNHIAITTTTPTPVRYAAFSPTVLTTGSSIRHHATPVHQRLLPALRQSIHSPVAFPSPDNTPVAIYTPSRPRPLCRPLTSLLIGPCHTSLLRYYRASRHLIPFISTCNLENGFQQGNRTVSGSQPALILRQCRCLLAPAVPLS